MGDLLMMEKLLQAFLESEQRGMASQNPLFCRSNNTTKTCDAGIQTNILPPYVLASGENTTGCFDIHTPSKPVEDYFIASHDALQHLVATLARYDGNCPLCGFTLDMQLFTVKQHGHAARISISCVAGLRVRWYSSSTVAGKFTANLRMVHGFTCSGLTETQYINSCKLRRLALAMWNRNIYPLYILHWGTRMQ
ncbi:unnamed protein product [Porites lobata]|uniref:Uncharacterized protein n=1 Tax=Porites lobata TaxID=104759 RepID=A0ABN8RJL4_9CNID|nr:unnamed protein product [Porites lobata]